MRKVKGEGKINVDLLKRPVLKWIVGQVLSGGERLVNKQQVYDHTCLQTTDNKQVYDHTCLQTTDNNKKYMTTLVYKQQTTNNKYTTTLVYKQQTNKYTGTIHFHTRCCRCSNLLS